MCLAEPLVASLTARSDQSVFCRLARWESPGFTCRSATMTLGSPAPRLPGTGEGSKPTGTCHTSPLFQTKWFADALRSWCVWGVSGWHGGLGAGKKWLKSRMWKHELSVLPPMLPSWRHHSPSLPHWPNSCPKELGVVLCAAGMCSRGEGDHSVGVGSWICCHEILILCFSY